MSQQRQQRRRQQECNPHSLCSLRMHRSPAPSTRLPRESFQAHATMLFFETSGILISFVLLGKWLEMVARGKASNAVRDRQMTPREEKPRDAALCFLHSGSLLSLNAWLSYPLAPSSSCWSALDAQFYCAWQEVERGSTTLCAWFAKLCRVFVFFVVPRLASFWGFVRIGRWSCPTGLCASWRVSWTWTRLIWRWGTWSRSSGEPRCDTAEALVDAVGAILVVLVLGLAVGDYVSGVGVGVAAAAVDARWFSLPRCQPE